MSYLDSYLCFECGGWVERHCLPAESVAADKILGGMGSRRYGVWDPLIKSDKRHAPFVFWSLPAPFSSTTCGTAYNTFLVSTAFLGNFFQLSNFFYCQKQPYAVDIVKSLAPAKFIDGS